MIPIKILTIISLLSSTSNITSFQPTITNSRAQIFSILSNIPTNPLIRHGSTRQSQRRRRLRRRGCTTAIFNPRYYARSANGDDLSSAQISSSSSPPKGVNGNDKGKRNGKVKINLMGHDWENASKDKVLFKKMREERTMHTALCIVPPDEAWDTIQRARVMSKDNTLYRWPPIIRLFHPFAPHQYLASAATTLATLIEKQKIKPFEVTLDQLVILPHLEILERQLAELPQPPPPFGDGDDIDEDPISDDDKAVQELIENEEKRGRARYVKRMARQGKEMPPPPPPPALSPRQQRRQQRRRAAQKSYNGPCVIALSPSESSRLLLTQLRQTLRQELFSPYLPFSPSSTLSNPDEFPPEEKEADYRPVIALGSFTTVTAAVSVAKKLQRLWEPLAFNVTELHFISGGEEENSGGTTAAVPMGCDAMVFLHGADMGSGDGGADDDDELLSLLMEEGESGDVMKDYEEILTREEMKARSKAIGDKMSFVEEMEDMSLSSFWEDMVEDDDWNEGATIVIGRTQFFLGEMRQYVGMPALPLDGKLRLENQKMSGITRRMNNRRSWKTGSFGSNDGSSVSD